MTPNEIAARVGVSRPTVLRWCKRDGCPHTVDGQYYLARYSIEPEAFRRWASRRYFVLSKCSDAGRAWVGGAA